MTYAESGQPTSRRRTNLMSHPYIQQTTLSTAKTHASNIGSPKIRFIERDQEAPNREQNGEHVAYPMGHNSHSMKEHHRAHLRECGFNRMAGVRAMAFLQDGRASAGHWSRLS
jgi:hypothetical protein